MSQSNRVSAVLTEQDAKDLKNYLALISGILAPIVIGLSEEERMTIPKMGDKTISFGEKAGDYCLTNPEFAPGYLDKEEFKKDLDLLTELSPVLKALNVLCSDVDDTVMLSSSEAFMAALYYYHSVKFAAEKGNVAAKPIYEDLAKRFPGSPRKAKKDDTQPK